MRRTWTNAATTKDEDNAADGRFSADCQSVGGDEVVEAVEGLKKLKTQRLTVDAERCLGCGVCMSVCPFMVYEIKKDKKGKKKAVPIYQEDCFLCQSCQAQCPVDAITIDW